MKKAKVRFSYGEKCFEIGDIVPAEIADTYPKLVENATEEYIKKPEPEPKNDGTISI